MQGTYYETDRILCLVLLVVICWLIYRRECNARYKQREIAERNRAKRQLDFRNERNW